VGVRRRQAAPAAVSSGDAIGLVTVAGMAT
jgi:hypothetical protein